MIGMLLETDYPKDIRVRKEAESLVELGHDVLVIVPWKEGLERKEVVNGVHVHRIGKNYSFKRRGIQDAISAIFFFNPWFYFKVKNLIREYGIVHLHVHDLPLAKTGLRLKKYISGKLILDSHENYPELLEGWFAIKKSPMVTLKNKLLFQPKRWKKYEHRILPKMDYVITVIEEMRNKFIEIHQLAQEKVLVIANYEKKEFVQLSKNQEPDDFSFDADTKHIVYVGGIGPMRGLDIVIQSLVQLNKHEEYRGTKFLILGSGNPLHVKKLTDLTRKLELEEQVLFLGYKAFSKVNFFMKEASINVIPHIKNGHTDFTIPHKLFQNFLSRTPVLVSSCAPLKRIVETSNAGWVFEAGSVDSCANKLMEIFSNPSLVEERNENAFEAAMTLYSWENEADKLNSFYQKISV